MSGIKLVCVADLAINAGGTAVYASGKLEGFTWSCALVVPISKLLEEECVKDISPPLEPLIPEMEIPGLSAGVEASGLLSIVPPPPSPVLGRVGVDFLIDPVSIYWYRVLRVLGHMILFISRIQQDGADITVKLVSNKMFVFRKLCRNNSRSPGEEALSTDVARILENNRFI